MAREISRTVLKSLAMNTEEAIRYIQESDDDSEEFDANGVKSEEMNEVVPEPINDGENDDNFESDFELEDMEYMP